MVINLPGNLFYLKPDYHSLLLVNFIQRIVVIIGRNHIFKQLLRSALPQLGCIRIGYINQNQVDIAVGIEHIVPYGHIHISRDGDKGLGLRIARDRTDLPHECLPGIH